MHRLATTSHCLRKPRSELASTASLTREVSELGQEILNETYTYDVVGNETRISEPCFVFAKCPLVVEKAKNGATSVRADKAIVTPGMALS